MQPGLEIRLGVALVSSSRVALEARGRRWAPLIQVPIPGRPAGSNLKWEGRATLGWALVFRTCSTEGPIAQRVLCTSPARGGRPEGDAGDGPLRLSIPKFTMMMLPTVATRHKQHGRWQRAAGTSLVAGAGRKPAGALASARARGKMPGSCHSRGSWRRGHVTSGMKPGSCSTLNKQPRGRKLA
jgi:hypothetical protein